MSEVLSMPDGYYDALKRLTEEVAGIVLEDDYKFTIETRLSVLARLEGFPSLIEMVQSMFKSGDSRLAIKMVASMLVRDTHFFRDKASLLSLSDFILPRLHKIYGARPIKILIVGCNSGQEAYSAAIMADKLKKDKLPDLNVELTAIDYPSQALELAKLGRFTHFDVQRGLAVRDMLSYFAKVGEDWVINEQIRNKITFRETHLLRMPDDLGRYNVIICRDVLSWFKPRVKNAFTRKIAKHIVNRGYMLIGSDEVLPLTVHPWISSGGPESVYQREKTEKELRDEELAARAARKLLHPDPTRFFDDKKIVLEGIRPHGIGTTAYRA